MLTQAAETLVFFQRERSHPERSSRRLPTHSSLRVRPRYRHASHLASSGGLRDGADLDASQFEAPLWQRDSMKPWFTQSAKKQGWGEEGK